VVRIPVGTKAQSVPGQDELPRTFETVEQIEARPEWNALRVPVTAPVTPATGDTELYLAGTATGLNPGDVVLLIGDERANSTGNENWDVRRVRALQTVERSGAVGEHTVVTVDEPLGKPNATPPAQQNPKVYALRTTAAVFGHNALPWSALPSPLRVGEWVGNPLAFVTGPLANRQNSWADAAFAAGTTEIVLDRTYPGVAPGGWAVLATPTEAEVYGVDDVAEVSQADYLLSAQVTRLTLSGERIEFFSPRTAAVFARSELLPMAEKPITEPVGGSTVELAELVDGLQPGRLVAIRGTRQDTGADASEVRRIAAVQSGARTTLVLTEDLTYEYLPDSVRVNANVAAATEGESRTEVLGSGNGAVPFQQFALLGTPLTYVSAATPSGGRSTLEIRVDGVLWTEVGSLYGQPSQARVYVTRLADDGTVTVRFGDGRTGSRLPSGRDNVVASYRVGTGLGGNLDPDRISLLLSRPLGTEEVINSAAATGGDDPEQLVRARRNAPTTVLTLDRIVSLRDYEDFARSFSGVGKASASVQWNGERQLVRLVVATTDGQPIDPQSTLYTNLLDGIDAARHVDHQVVVDPYLQRPFVIVLKVTVDPDRLAADVFPAVTAALSDAFSFERRDFGQRVAASEVLATVQAVPGVHGTVLVALHLAGQPAVKNNVLPAADPSPADLLTISEITLTELTEPLP
jgi:predicted phage baseplate assembly protein